MFLHRRPVCSAVAHSRDGRTPRETSRLSDSGKKQPYKVPALLILLVLFFFSPRTPKHLPLTPHFFSPPPPVPVRRTTLLHHQINSSLFQLWFTRHHRWAKHWLKQLLHMDIYLPPPLKWCCSWNHGFDFCNFVTNITNGLFTVDTWRTDPKTRSTCRCSFTRWQLKWRVDLLSSPLHGSVHPLTVL